MNKNFDLQTRLHCKDEKRRYYWKWHQNIFLVQLIFHLFFTNWEPLLPPPTKLQWVRSDWKKVTGTKFTPYVFYDLVQISTVTVKNKFTVGNIQNTVYSTFRNWELLVKAASVIITFKTSVSHGWLFFKPITLQPASKLTQNIVHLWVKIRKSAYGW